MSKTARTDAIDTKFRTDRRNTDTAHGDPAPDADACVHHDCERTDDLRAVACDGRVRVLCPPHQKDFLGVSS